MMNFISFYVCPSTLNTPSICSTDQIEGFDNLDKMKIHFNVVSLEEHIFIELCCKRKSYRNWNRCFGKNSRIINVTVADIDSLVTVFFTFEQNVINLSILSHMTIIPH